jgi:opacity protein-like surface antigen
MPKKNKLLSVVAMAALLAATNAAAMARVVFAPGPYLGGYMGYGTIHQTDGIPVSEVNSFSDNDPIFPIFISNSSSSNGWAGRLFAGYQIVPYFGVELGYTKFSNTDLSTSASGTDASFIANTASVNATIKTYAVDLIGKLSLPLGSEGVFLFGTFGGAYLNEYTSVFGGNSDGFTPPLTAKVLPTFGAGLTYAFNSQLTADFAWSHIQNMGNQNLRNTDIWGIGFTYRMGY